MANFDLLQHQTAFGLHGQDLDLVIEDMAGQGKEAAPTLHGR